MATFTPKKLAFLQLSDTQSSIYYPVTEMGEIHNILLHNTNTTNEVVTLFLDDGAFEFQIYKVELVPDQTLQLSFGNEGFIVDESSYLSGSSTTANMVTCLVMGTGRVA